MYGKVLKVLISVTNISCNCETAKTVYLRSKVLEKNVKNFGFYLIKVQCRHCEDQMVNAVFFWGGGGIVTDWQHSNRKNTNALCDSRILEF
jgi:hypothetical protein